MKDITVLICKGVDGVVEGLRIYIDKLSDVDPMFANLLTDLKSHLNSTSLIEDLFVSLF